MFWLILGSVALLLALLALAVFWHLALAFVRFWFLVLAIRVATWSLFRDFRERGGR